jgi:hypothetical protein
MFEPMSWNRYTYVNDNATNFFDPFGLDKRRPGIRPEHDWNRVRHCAAAGAGEGRVVEETTSLVFRSFRAFKRTMGAAGTSMEWHHISWSRRLATRLRSANVATQFGQSN